MEADHDAAQRFLGLLDPEARSFTFQTFDDSDAKREELAVILHGSFEKVCKRLDALQRQGAGVFVTVNETDGKGRKERNIVRVRAVFVDLDDAPLDPVLQAPLPPQIVVESSPNKYHAYWICTDCPLDQFKRTQIALLRRFGGDPAVKDLSRVMRLPGFLHLKRAPFTSRLLK